MEPVLRNGDIGGKLVCPNEKCGAKIGNFDWAGVQCGCEEWVTPVGSQLKLRISQLMKTFRVSVSIAAKWTRFGKIEIPSSRNPVL